MELSTSFRGVSDAEEWIRSQLVCYLESSDVVEREQVVTRVLHVLSAETNLGAVCAELMARRPYLEYAYRHNLGFFVLYLTDPEIGFQCRLHIWMPDTPPVMEKPHRHRMGFSSKILSGELHSLHYQRIELDSDSPLAEGDQLYHETWINAPAEGSFDIAHTELEVRCDVVLRLLEVRRYCAGDSYFFSADGIHRACAPESRAEPTITLTVWEPPFQPSLAYEPIGSLGGAGSVRRQVVRVSEMRYLELVEIVRRALNLA